MPAVPLGLLLFSGAITPAICEEWFFSWVCDGILRRFWYVERTVLGSACLLALMHVLTSTCFPLSDCCHPCLWVSCWGLVAWRTGSLWPGVLLHVVIMAYCFRVGHFKAELTELGIGVEEGGHLPITWLAGGLLCSVVGTLLFRPFAARTRELLI